MDEPIGLVLYTAIKYVYFTMNESWEEPPTNGLLVEVVASFILEKTFEGLCRYFFFLIFPFSKCYY